MAFSCKEDNKKEEYVGPKEVIIPNSNTEEIVLETLNVSNSNKWTLKNINIDSTSQVMDYSILSRIEQNNSSYIISNAVEALNGSNYRVSIIAKKGANSALGLRITGIYPNRSDAIFDLENGKVIGTSSFGELSEEKAKIEVIDENWFKCSLTSKVESEKISVFFGPTASDTKVSHWESGNSSANDISVNINSVILEEISF